MEATMPEKKFYTVSTQKPVFIPLDKLREMEIYFTEGDRLFMLSRLPRDEYRLCEVTSPETLIELGLMKALPEPEPEGELEVPEDVAI
jgi:hypothetical protein